MRKHITNGETIQIRKMVANGITDVETIQKRVFCDACVIEPWIEKFAANADAPTPAPVQKRVVRTAKPDPLS